MLVPDTAAVSVLIVVGAGALGLATWLAVREAPPTRGGRARAASPLVPWLGSVAAVALAIRGALAAAGFVLLVTLVHAGLARWRALRPRRQDR